ncbi:hypothetical protein CsSME_00050522 [Camellia sinensis var. sinensis]
MDLNHEQKLQQRTIVEGLGFFVYMMSTIMVFVMWALVAMSGKGWVGDPLFGPEAVGLGSGIDWASEENWEGVEEVGEREEGELSWEVGRGTEDGESVSIFG